MRYTILFIVALILVSGFIAYFGDLLGRRMGKRRLTLFSLRPRHTAIIVTTITGMVIAALALVALIMVNSQFRRVLTHGEQIIAHNTQLTGENVRLLRKNRGLARLRASLEAQVAMRKQEAEDARKAASEAGAARDRAQAVVTRLSAEIARKTRELSDLRKRTDVAESRLAAKITQLASARRELAEAEKDLVRAQGDLIEAVNKLYDANEKLATTQEKLSETERQLADRDAELRRAEKFREQIKLESALTRQVASIANQGDEIGRGTVSPKQSEFAIRSDLYSLLERAGTRAGLLGAKVGDNGRAVVAVVRVYGPGADGKPVVVGIDDNENAHVESAASIIKSAPWEVLVQMLCAANTLPGEQVPVELKLYLNKPVFAKGEKIASQRIDGRLSEGRILLALTDFWKKDVSRAAVNAGIVPATGPLPGASDGRDTEERVDQLLRVLEEIKALSAVTQVSVYATQSIRAADLLGVDNVRFEVAKAE